MDSENISPIVLDLLKETLSEGKRMTIQASGNSMFPTIFPGDWITIQRIPFSEICLGDIILFKIEDKMVIHRVLRKEQVINTIFKFYTKGDFRWWKEPSIMEDSYYAKVIICGKSFSRQFSWRIINALMKFLQIKIDLIRIKIRLLTKRYKFLNLLISRFY